MPFDYAGARKAGYSDTEIIDFLAPGSGFNVDAARKAGYDDAEIAQHLNTRRQQETPNETYWRENLSGQGSVKSAPADTWAETGKKVLRRAVPGFKASAAGAVKGAIETSVMPLGNVMPGSTKIYDAVAKWTDLPSSREITDRALAAMYPDGVPGTQMGKEAREELNRNALNPGDSNAKYYIGMLADSLIQMAPSVAATMATRNPTIGLATMAGQVGGQQYGESRDERGRSVDEAKMDSIFMASAEILGESTILGRLLQPAGGKLLKEVLKTAGLEAGQEMVTQALQTGYQAGVLKDEMTLGQALKQVMDAGIIGAGMGATFHLGTAPFANRRPIAPGEIETAANDDLLSPEDLASPIPNDVIEEGKRATAVGEAIGRADDILRAAGMPGVKTRVNIDMGDGNIVNGIIEDAFDTDAGELGRATGLSIKLDDGRVMSEHFDDLRELGIKISEMSPLAESDAIAADLAANARQAEQEYQAALEATSFASPAEPSPAPVSAPVAAPAVSGGDAVARFMAKTRGGESSGDDAAKNPRSSATGRYQFVKGTFKQVYQQVYGGGESAADQAWATKRNDPAIQEALMQRLTSDNAKGLQAAGIAVNEGNLYLAHFAGIGGARAIIKANPNASVESVLGQAAVNANPFLKGKTAADVVAWAARKMGAEPGSAVGDYQIVNQETGETVDPYEQALKDYMDLQNTRNRGQDEPDDNLLIPTPRREGEQDDMFGGETLTESQMAARDTLPGVLDAVREEEPDADLETAFKELERGFGAWRQDGRNSDVNGYVDTDLVPDALFDAARRNPAIIETLGRQLQLPARGTPTATEAGAGTLSSPTAAPDSGPSRQQAGGVADANVAGPFAADIRGETIDREWTAFTPESGTLNVPRADMPQIKAEDRSAMVQFLKARGIDYTKKSFPAASLKPTQAEFSEAKVQKAKDYEGGNRAILVSSDGYLLDGHHQWLAARDAGEEVRAIQLDAPIRDLLKVVPEMPSATTADGSTDTKPVEVEARATVPQDVAPDEGLGPASVLSFQPKEGPPGVSVVSEDDAVATAVFRDEQGIAQGVVQMPLTPEAREMTGGVSSFVRPDARRQGIATRLYAALRDAGYPIDRESGTSDLTPDGAALVNSLRGLSRSSPSTARIEDTATGKGIAVIGASEAEIAAIAQAVPKAKATPPRKSDGGIVFSKKYEAEIRAALDGATDRSVPLSVGQPSPEAETTPAPTAEQEVTKPVTPDRSAAIIMDPAAGTVKTVPLGQSVPRRPTDKKNPNPYFRNGEKVTFSEQVEYLGGDNDTYTVEGATKSQVYFTNDRTGGRSSLQNHQMQSAIRAGKMSRVEADAAPAQEPGQVSVQEDADQPRSVAAKKVGDFYEFYDRDARVVADALGIVVTKRNGRDMAGIPAHAIENDRADLAKAGIKVLAPDLDQKAEPQKTATPATEKAAESKAGQKPDYGSQNKVFTQDAAEKARALLRSKRNQLNAGFDPEIAQAGLTLMGYHIEAGARSFIDASRAVANDLGLTPSQLKSSLRSWYTSARNWMEDNGYETRGMDDDATVKADLAKIETWGGEAQEDTATAAENADPVMALRDRLLAGERFATIVEARKALAEITGETIKPGTPEAKRADEIIEAAVVQAARKIAAREQDPLTTYRELVDLYQRQPSLNVRTSTSIEQQAYSTPVPLAFLASQRAGITQETTVYEPSAGNGALLIDARATYITANELNPDRARQLREIYRGAEITQEDASTFTPPGPQRDVVIANPPFGVVKDEDGDTRMFEMGDGYITREIDHAISLLALDSMKDNGRAALIVGSVAKTAQSEKARADAYNAKAKREFYYRLYSEYNVTDHFTVAGELYSRQGAGWPVDVIVVEGRGKSKLPLPAVKPPRQYDNWTALEEALERRPDLQQAVGVSTGDAASEVGEPASRDERTGGSGDDGRTDRQRQPSAAEQPGGVREGLADGQPDGGRLAGGEDADAIPDRNDRDRAGSRPPQVKRAPVAPVAGENERQVTYQPASGAKSLETLVPTNMQTAIGTALDNLQSRVGKVDDFVADRLGYDPAKIADYFSAEQVDALALALDNMERGAGFIIGDQTGIGKGRVVAGIIRYALKSERMPIFVTEKPNLYADMYRDMNDIGIPEMLGKPVDILMTNASEKVPLNEDGTEVLKTGSAASHNQLLNRVADGDRDNVDVLFTTYSQMQAIRGEWTPRQRAIARLAPGSILIFDESHNAGGQGKKDDSRKSKKQKAAEEAGITAPNRAQFARQIAAQAHGVFFSSATYAKRPEVMDLYASTDMRLAVADIDKLADAIGKGGIPMQQIVASTLTEAGQYVRRERSFEGVEYRTPPVEVDRTAYSQFTGVLRAIQSFQEVHITDAVEAIADDIKAEAQAVGYDGSVGSAGATSTNFTSVMHNLVEQMLLAMKAKPAADTAISALEAGQKPVITVANTMGSFLEEYAEENNIGNGQPMPLDFRSLLKRYLERTRRLTIKKPFSKDKATVKYISDEELGPAGVASFNNVAEMIEAMDLGAVPVSPVDYIRNALTEAGYRVGEITGRTATLDYSGKTPRYRIRPGKEKSIEGRRAAITGFNNGKIDAMVLNQAGSTGLSLHASSTFKDQRPRVMIIAQAERNIDTHMQMLGRVHRTGQVVLPSYDQLVAAVPAEMRPAAVLAKKMASLNANTTGARDSAVTAEEVPDFMNEYGDEIAARMMEEDDILHSRLGKPLKESQGEQEGLDRSDAARRVTGRLMLLPLDEQEAFYERFLAEYADYLAQKEAAGESSLEAKTLDLDAKQVDVQQVIAPTHPTSPFGAGVDREVLDVRRLGKPMKPEQVIEDIAEGLGRDVPNADPTAALDALSSAGAKWMGEFKADNLAEFDAYSRETLDSIEDEKRREINEQRLSANREAFNSITRVVHPGASVAFLSEDGDLMAGIVLGVERKQGSKNPLALGSYRASIAPVGASGRLTIPFSQIRTRSMPTVPGQREVQAVTHADGMPIMQAFEEAQMEAREKRTMLTGNILAAFEHTGGKGQIVNFIDGEGNVRPGLMMRRGYDYAKEIARRPVPFRTPEQVVAWLDQGEIAMGDGVSIERKGNQIEIVAAASKSAGGNYFLDPTVRKLVGGDFIKRSNGMVADAPGDRAVEVARALISRGANFMAKTNLEKAREIVAGDAPLQSIPTETGTPAPIDTEELQARLEGYGLKRKVALQVVETLNGAAGEYRDALIRVATDTAQDGTFTLDHEAVHAMRGLGMLNTSEWAILAAKAKRDPYLMRSIKQRYARLNAEAQAEEAVADMFARYQRGDYKADGTIARVFKTLRQALEAIGNAFAGRGLRTAEGVMQNMASGEVGNRESVPNRGGGSAQFSVPDNFTDRFGRDPNQGPDDRTFSDPETEQRFQDAAEGLGDKGTLLVRAQEWTMQAWHGISRHWIELPNEPKYASLQEKLRAIEAAPQVAKERTIRMLEDMTKDLDADDMDLFTRKVILDDLSWDALNDRELPFGFTSDSLAKEKAKIDGLVMAQSDRRVWNAVMKRKVANRRIAQELVDAGVLEAEAIKNPAYYRHQVLEYARAQFKAAHSPGNKLKTPKWAKRMGSTLDINANLLEAEFDWLNKSFVDIPVAKSIEWIKRSEHNILPDLQKEARASNKAGIDAIIADAEEKLADPADYSERELMIASMLVEQEKGFRQNIAFGFKIVRDALEQDAINVPKQFEKAADAIVVGSRNSNNPPFPFLSWLLDNNEPGANGAALIMKAVSQRRVWTQNLLGKSYVDPMNADDLVKSLAPEGYRTWQPDTGNLLFTVKTVPEHIVDKMLAQLDAPEGVNETAFRAMLEQSRNMLVMGGSRYTMILPEDVANTLDNLRRQDMENLFSHLVKDPVRYWKRWVLINPRRWLKYNINNMSGDMDAALAGNPRAIGRMKEAAVELAAVMRKKQQPSARYNEAIERGVFDSGLSIQEIPDINVMEPFERFSKEGKTPTKTAKMVLSKAWGALQGSTQWRENILRYAAYLDYVERLEAGEDMAKIGYGASRPVMVDAVEDVKDKAALLARDLVGDYGAISHYGGWLRESIIPFWSWAEINTKRYWRLSANAYSQGVGKGLATGGALAFSAGARTTAALTIRMALLYGLMSVWNNLIMGDEEDELDEFQKAQMHIVLGRNDAGEIITLRTQGAFSDALGWFGLGDMGKAIKNYQLGRGDFLDIVAAPPKAVVNRLATSLSPVINVPIEAATGRKLWPNVFEPRQIPDRWRNFWSTFSLENEYDQFTQSPTRGYGRSWQEAVVYRRDPGEIAYNEARGIAYEWLERERGQEFAGGFKSPRSDAYRKYRTAMKYGDESAAEQAWSELAKLQTTTGDVDGMLKRAAPLGPLAVKDRQEFVEQLTDEEYTVFQRAQEWYEGTFLAQ